MPYEVIDNADNCSGFAVVKVGETTPIEGGCHHTKEHADDHASALNIATADEEERAIDLSAPQFMRNAAKRGLKMYADGHGGDGLVQATISSARKMANGQVSIEKWKKIGPWIARHLVDLDAPKNNNPNHPDYPGAGLVAHLLWGSGPSKEQARRAMNYANRIVERYENEEGRAGDPSTPAPKKDQIFGSDKNKPGSAKGPAGSSTITLTDAVEKSLQNKTTEHNQRMSELDKPAWTKVTVGALRSVYRRGAGAFSTSHRPGMTRGQWAMGRVNAFLYLAEKGKPENPKYVADNDLLNKEHPKYSKADRAMVLQNEQEEMMDEELIVEPEEEMDEEAVSPETLIESLRELLSDAVSFYFQAHGAHWNVRGQDFAQYHELFGNIYEDAYSAIDPIAENIRKVGGEAPFLLQDFINLSSVRQTVGQDSTESLASQLLVANEQILMCLRNTFEVAEELDEQGICNFIAERIDNHQKWGWQLRASLDLVSTRSASVEWVTKSIDDKRSVAYSNMEVRAIGEGNTLVGYAALWDMPSQDMGFTEYVVRGAFTKTLKDGADVRLLFDHEGAPLARTKSGTLRLSEDDRGLRVEADLDPANPLAQSIMSALRRGDLNQMSFAFRTIKDSWNTSRSVRELREVQLFDVSVVTYPAYEQTIAELRSMQYDAPTSPIRLRRQQIALAKHK